MSVIYSEQLGAIRLAELNKFAQHIPAEVLTMRVLEIAIESSGLTIGDVIDLHERVEDHAKATRLTSMFLHEWAHWANAAVGKVEGSDGTEVLVNLEKVEPPDEWTYSGSSQPETEAPAVTPEPAPEEADTDAEPEVSAPEEVQEQSQKEVPEGLEEQALKSEPEPKVETESEPQEEAEPTEKTCRDCGKTKPIEEFSRYRWGRMHMCIQCRKDKWNKNHPSTEEEKPEQAKKKRHKSCARGKDCVAYERTGEATRIAANTKRTICYPCEDARGAAMRRGEKVDW